MRFETILKSKSNFRWEFKKVSISFSSPICVATEVLFVNVEVYLCCWKLTVIEVVAKLMWRAASRIESELNVWIQMWSLPSREELHFSHKYEIMREYFLPWDFCACRDDRIRSQKTKVLTNTFEKMKNRDCVDVVGFWSKFILPWCRHDPKSI